MNNADTLKILSVLRGAYPAFYRDMTRQDADGVVALWTEMFADEPYQLVAAAVKALIATDDKGYPPHIGAVKARIRQLLEPRAMTEAEAWGLVHRATRRGLYNSQEEFEKLPPEIQSIVGSANQIREWAMMSADEVGTVVASNFQRSYRARAASIREYAALPADVKAFADSVLKKIPSLPNRESDQSSTTTTTDNAPSALCSPAARPEKT